MAKLKLEFLLGLSTVTAKLYKYAFRVHGNTLQRFAPFLNLKDPLINKQITQLTSATAQFLETDSRYAGNKAWENIRLLDKAISRLSPDKQSSALLELERSIEMLLVRDNDLKKLIGKEIEDFRLFRLAKVFNMTLKNPAATGAIISQWSKSIYSSGGELLKIFKRFKEIVSLDEPAVTKASAYIFDNSTKLKKAVENSDKQALLGYLSNVRGFLGEGYALLSKEWRIQHTKALKKAKKIAQELGKDYRVVSLSQIQNKIFLGGKEGPDQMIVLINRKRKEVIPFLVAQVKIANKSEAILQTINDVVNRELKFTSVFEYVYKEEKFALRLIQDQRVATQRYILNATGSIIPRTDLELLNKYGIQEVSEIVLNFSVEQFSYLAIRMIEEGLNIAKKIEKVSN
jgi:hypothetical protein